MNLNSCRRHTIPIHYYLFTARVQMKICTNIAQSPVARNDMVSSNFSIPGKRKKRIRKILMRH